MQSRGEFGKNGGERAEKLRIFFENQKTKTVGKLLRF